MSESTTSFKEHFATLKDVAETLRTQEPDIDELLPLVDKGIQAHKACKERLDLVRKAFAEKMPVDGAE